MRRACVPPALLLFTLVTGPVPASAQAAQTFEPIFAQPGKDVVWVPTPEPMVELMLDMAGVTAADRVVDLGSGDGRLVIAAARRGATARGVEFNPDMVRLAKRRAYEAGVQERATFVEGDMFEADISDATVMALFLLTDNMRRLQPRFLSLRPGTRIVSNTFAFPEWPADGRRTRDACTAWCTALLWIVPAQVHGTWQLAGGQSLVLDQHFQKITGVVAGPLGSSTIQDGSVTGAEVAFSVGGASWKATVEGDRMRGVRAEGGAKQPWQATRATR